MLKFIYDTEGEIPAHARGEYTQNGEGKYELQVQGAVSASFRDKNNDLLRERDTIKGQLKPLQEAGLLDDKLVPVATTIAEFTNLRSIKDQLDTQKLVKSDKLDEAVAKQTQAMKEAHERESKAKDAAIAQRDEELARLKIDNEITQHAVKHGAEPWAIEDIVRRGRDKFKLEDGKVVAYKKNAAGELEKDYGSKQGGLLTIEEWAAELPTQAPGYFKKSSGGGGDASKGEGKGGHALLQGKGNPWLKGTPHYNLTLQGQIEKADAALAQRLKAEAGAAK